MKVRIPKCIKNPVFMSALICMFLFYSEIIKPKQTFFVNSLFSLSDICVFEGKIISNATKSNTFGVSYKAKFKIRKAFNKTNASCTCDGVINILIPKKIFESVLPGKNYTSAKKNAGILFDDGVNLRLNVLYSPSQQYKKNDAPYNYLVQSAVLIESGFEKSFFGFIKLYRARTRLRFIQLMYSWNNAGGLLLALLSGVRDYTEANIATSFKLSGLSHILALSGMHLALFGGISFFLGRKTFGKRLGEKIELLSILFFVWFAGFSPSLVRALLCSLITLFCSLFRLNKPNEITTLSLAFLIQSSILSEQLFEVAFLLSYTSLYGILLVSDYIKRILSNRFIPQLSASISASISAQLFTSPISFVLFKKIMPIGIVSTVIVSPLITIFIYLGLIGIFLCLLTPFLSSPFNVIMNFTYNVIKNVVLFFAGFPAITNTIIG